MKNENDIKALFRLAEIDVLGVWEMANQYLPRHPDHFQRIVENPWWIVKTRSGLIICGPRKRVFEVNWSDTPLRFIVTCDDVTKDECSVHAWTMPKLLEYLTALGIEIKKSVEAP